MEDAFEQNLISYLEDELSHCTNYDSFLEGLEKKYNADELPLAYNYILNNKKDSALLNKTIKKINRLKNKNNLNCLIDFILKTADVDLKVMAIKTISGYQDKSALNALMYCLNDKNSNYKVRLASAEALGKIGDRTAFEPLTNIVCDENENSAYVKESAVTALGMLGDERALDVFDFILGTKQMFLDKFSYLKERIVEAMSKFDISKDERAIKILKQSLMDINPHLRIAAIETLSNSEFDFAWDLIKERLDNDDDIEVRKNALIALYNISDRDILDEVIRNDYPEEVKECAIEIIREYEENDE